MSRLAHKFTLAGTFFFFGDVTANELTEDDFLSEEPIIISSATRILQALNDVPVLGLNKGDVLNTPFETLDIKVSLTVRNVADENIMKTTTWLAGKCFYS